MWFIFPLYMLHGARGIVFSMLFSLEDSNLIKVRAQITTNPSRHEYETVHVNLVHNTQHSTILTFKIHF